MFRRSIWAGLRCAAVAAPILILGTAAAQSPGPGKADAGTVAAQSPGPGKADAGPATKPADAQPAAQPAKPPAPRFDAEIRYFEEADRGVKTKGPRVVFIGSSSIRLWDTLAQDFPRHQVLNRGFGGSHISDSVTYAERILSPHKPPLVIMYAGSNDIDAGKSPHKVASDFAAFTERVWSILPTTTIAFISIAPNPARFSQVDRVREANRLIASFCASDKRLRFIDVFPRMLGDNGRPLPELYAQDGLHMNHKGYELWTPLVRDVLDEVVPPQPLPKETRRRSHSRS